MARFLVVLDVDSTLIEDEVIDLLAEAAGKRKQVTEITLAAMNGDQDFDTSLTKRVSTLAGLPETVFAEVLGQIKITPGVPELISGVHSAGGRVAVCSGGFQEIIDPLGKKLGLDYWRANRLEVRNGCLSGRVIPPIINAAAKAQALQEWAADMGIPLGQTIAVGDGANDLMMMALAGLSVGFSAKAPVREAADLLLDDKDLSLLLPLIGVSLL